MALEPCASFEPDEHLATLVLQHVGEMRDRLALECCSRAWRAAGQIPGVWQSQDLILTGDLAARLTDARARHVLRRAGTNLRSLVVNDAPAGFTGEGLRASLVHEARRGAPAGVAQVHGLPTPPAPAFVRLQTLDLRRCPGVTGGVIIGIMRDLRIHDVPKAERLQRLALAGCGVHSKARVRDMIENKHSTQIGILSPSGIVRL
jgi:hypothetical protein